MPLHNTRSKPPTTLLAAYITATFLLASALHATHAAAIRPDAINLPAPAAPQTSLTPSPIDIKSPEASHLSIDAAAVDVAPAHRSQRRSKEAKLPPALDSVASSAADTKPIERKTDSPPDTAGDLQTAASERRQHKMLDYFGLAQSGFFSAPALYPSHPYQPHPYFGQQFYDPQPGGFGPGSFGGLGGLAGLGGLGGAGTDTNEAGQPDDEIMGRANRRKPSVSAGGNSPIFYIRLPPTPYMFVPGMGYISQPPTIRPMSQQFPAMLAAPPQQPQAPIPNPFINVPVSFLANGKPTNVYEWPGAAAASAPAPVQHVGPVQPPMLGYGPGGPPQYPPYLPARPLQPSRPPGYRPQKPQQHAAAFLPDSKITHLKGPYVFNGRPEEIFVLPGQQQQQQQQQYFNAYAHHQQELQQQQQAYEQNAAYSAYHSQQQQQQQQHSQQHHHHHQPLPPQSVYGDGYNTMYSNGLYGYY